MELYALVTWEDNDFDNLKITLFRTEAEADHYADIMARHNENFECQIVPATVAPRLKGRRAGSKAGKNNETAA